MVQPIMEGDVVPEVSSLVKERLGSAPGPGRHLLKNMNARHACRRRCGTFAVGFELTCRTYTTILPLSGKLSHGIDRSGLFLRPILWTIGLPKSRIASGNHPRYCR